MIAALKLSSGAGTTIDLLVTAHRSGGAGAGTPEYEKLCTDLIATQGSGSWSLENEAVFRELAAVDAFREFAAVAVHGDPEHWPGLTAPAVGALEDLLHLNADDIQAGVVREPFPLRARLVGNTILDEYGSRGAPKQYERLALVLERLAVILPHLPKYQTTQAHRSVALPMAEMLRDAPTQALLGPLQPLVQAFGQRILDKKVSPKERRSLKRIPAGRNLSDQQAEALRPIAEAL